MMAWELSDGLERRGARLRRQSMRHSEVTPNALPGHLYVRESLLLARDLNRRSQFIPPGFTSMSTTYQTCDTHCVVVSDIHLS